MDRLSRRSFIQASAGGAAFFAAPAALAFRDRAAGQGAPQATRTSTRVPREPVMAYVRDARRGEVTVMSGAAEATYRDPVLVKRLLDAAPAGLQE